jgi:hypothetical protein
LSWYRDLLFMDTRGVKWIGNLVGIMEFVYVLGKRRATILSHA